MTGLIDVFKAVGFPKAGQKYAIRDDDDEDEDVAVRAISMLSGVLHLLQTHIIGYYERSALLNETEQLAAAFRKVQCEQGNSGLSAAISAAYTEMTRTVKDRKHQTMTQLDNTINNQAVLMSVARVAEMIAGPSIMATMDNDQILEARRTNEPPDELVRVIATAIDKCYLAPANENVRNMFRMHARAQARNAIEFICKQRGLTPKKEPHVD